MSGRKVLLQVYSDPGSEIKLNGQWSLSSAQYAGTNSAFGLELDLDRFMIVAARDFNMGAMENKGLNIFNAAYVLADPKHRDGLQLPSNRSCNRTRVLSPIGQVTALLPRLV